MTPEPVTFPHPAMAAMSTAGENPDIHLDYGQGFNTPVCGWFREGTTLSSDRAMVTCKDCKRREPAQ